MPRVGGNSLYYILKGNSHQLDVPDRPNAGWDRRVEAFRLERKSLVTDFVIADHRSIVSIFPVSAAACEWLDANVVTEPWQWMDGAVVEHRCARDILTAA